MTGWNLDLPEAEYFSPADLGSDRFQHLMNEVSQTKLVAIDTETTGITNWKCIPLYWSLAFNNRRMTLHAGLLPYFREIFAQPKRDWIFANAKFDAHMLANVGCTFEGRLVDTQVMHSLLYEEKPHKLKFMAQHLLGWTWADFEDTFGKIGVKQSAEDRIRKAEAENMPLLIEYAANDAWGTLKVHSMLDDQLKRAGTHSLFRTEPPYIETLHDLFHKIEVDYTKVLWKMERKGVLVNRARLEEAAPKAQEEIDRILKDIAKLAGRVLNPGSSKQMQEYFFGKVEEGGLGLAPIKWTKGGKSGNRAPAVDKIVMEALAATNEVAELCQLHGAMTQLHDNYLVGLHNHLDPNSRIHTKFNQDVARTGRLSSSEPNLQNIPKPEKDKWNIRDAFLAPPGKVFISADYAALEMRLLAAAAGEQGMIDVFARNWDIHMGNASLMFGIPYEDIEKAKKTEKLAKNDPSLLTAYVMQCLDARAAAKAIGFGLNYGMGVTKLARTLKCTPMEAQAKINAYKKTYPAISMFFEEAVHETEQTGYAFTLLGRRRNVPEIASYRKEERALGERLAINTQIQGSAADVAKMAQINIDRLRLDYHYGCDMLLQVHDEINFECPVETSDRCMREIQDAMEHPFLKDLAVHLAVEIGKGDSWMKAK